jgi:hypothetical protein
MQRGSRIYQIIPWIAGSRLARPRRAGSGAAPPPKILGLPGPPARAVLQHHSHAEPPAAASCPMAASRQPQVEGVATAWALIIQV